VNLEPLHDRALLKRSEEATKTKSGIVIPDTAREKPQEGQVVAVGTGKRDDAGKIHPLTVKAGDQVLVGKYTGSEVTIDGQEFVVVREDEILGIVH
jgi:chaperonin GroES